MEIFSKQKDIAREAGEAVSRLLKEKLETPVLLMLSGGSVFEILGYVDERVLGKWITITVVDERYSIDPKINNFRQLQETLFYKKAVERGCEFIDTGIREGESLLDLQRRFEESLQSWKKDNPNGVVVAVLGIGTDGHTVGIMPFPENQKKFIELFENGSWTVGYDAGNKNQYPFRVTTSITFMRKMVDYVFVYVVGENKRKIFEKVLEEAGNVYEIPARIIHEMREVKIFTDLCLQ